MKNKTGLLVSLAIAGMLHASGAQAQEEAAWSTSASMALTSEYRFRGTSQTQENPAIQGSIEWAHEEGWYIGSWGSNIGFAGSLETDFFTGIRRRLNDGTVGDVGIVWYHYPSASTDNSVDSDFFEIYGILSFDDVSPLEDEISVGVFYTSKNYGKSGQYNYLFVDYSTALPHQLSVGVHLGYNIWHRSNPGIFGTENQYIDWSASLGLDALGANWSVALVGSNLKQSACGGNGDNCKTKLVFTLSKSF